MLVKLIGIVVLVGGVVYLLKPDAIKQYIAFWTKGKRISIGAGLSLLFGIILLRAASECVVSWVVTTFGVLAIIKGLVLFVLGPEKAVSKLKWWRERPDSTLRLIGIIALAIGALLIYSV